MKGKWRIVVGLLLGAAAITWVISRVPCPESVSSLQCRLFEVWKTVRETNVPLLILSALVATMIFPLRALRWRTILHPVDPNLSFSLLWRATCVGFGLNNLLPLRLGEVARALALARGARRVGLGASAASLAVDRIFDAIALLLLMFVGAMALPAISDSASMARLTSWITGFVVIVGLIVLVTYFLAFFPVPLIAVYRRVARRISPRIESLGTSLLTSFAAGLSVLKSPGRFAAVLIWAVLHWLVNALAFWIGFQALGIEASFMAALFTQGCVAIAASPPQAPAFFGTFQAAAVLALGFFGVPEASATAWGFAYWLFSFIPITMLGLMYAAQMHLSFSDLRQTIAGPAAKGELRVQPLNERS